MDCVVVQLNDIVDENVFTKRMETALNIGGRDNFWKNFFSCETRCLNGGRFIYLITDYQLKLLYDWWYKKIKSDKLLSNRQPFHSLGPIRKTPDEENFAEDYICCVSYTYDHHVKYKRVLFLDAVEKNLNNENVISFFRGKISAEEPVKTHAADHEERIWKLLGNNSKIKENPKHGNRAKEVNKNEKWLYYLSLNKIDRLLKHKNIVYCSDIDAAKDESCNNKCPFVKSLIS